ncbi:MAG: DUF3014 domain-containing protein [Steroidobacteraceae bacterium]
MQAYLKWLIPVIVIGGAGACWYFMDETLQTSPTVETDVTEVSSSAAAIHYPLSADHTEVEPLPTLSDSDTWVQASLEKLLSKATLAELLIPTQIIRHIVATVDNLPRSKLTVTLRPVRATPGSFVVSGDETDRVLSTDNYARYRMIMGLIESADINTVANWYRQHYALFQEAYRRLGYPQGYFNDRLVQTIDNLLDTPELVGPIHLVQPNVFYEFSDPELEARSAGQKTLLRMGPDNTRIIKTKLHELRAAVIRSEITPDP